jgi:hypothetical protein
MTKMVGVRAGLVRSVSLSALAMTGVFGVPAARAADTTISVDTVVDQVWTSDNFIIAHGVTLESFAPVGTDATVGTLTVNGTINESDLVDNGGAIDIFEHGVVDAIDIALGGTVLGTFRGINIREATITTIANAGTLSGGQEAIDNYQGNIGSIVNSGDMSGSRYVILNHEGTIGSITNTASGQLIGTADRANGITNNGTITGAIVNDGLIDMSSTTVNSYTGTYQETQANPIGIYNLGSVDSITNSGTIRATGTANAMGIENDNGTDTATIGTLTNTGSIVTNSYSNVTGSDQAYATGIVSWGGSIGTLNNSGSITATGYTTTSCTSSISTDSCKGAYAYGMWLYGTDVTTLENSGAISGLIADGNTDGWGYGIKASAGTAISTFENSGTISGSTDGLNNSAAITNLNNTGTIRGTTRAGIRTTSSGSIGTIDNSGTISGEYGIYESGAAATIGSIVNTGTISGNLVAITLSTASAITNSGVIRGGTNSVPTTSILFGANGNSLNILPTAQFYGVVDYNNTTGNTTTFGAGSYSVPASNYLDASNTITLNNAKQFVVLDHPNSTGTINVVALSAGDQSATQYTASVSDVIGSIVALDVARPDQVTIGDSTISALQYGEEKPETKAAKALRQLGDGLAVDGYGNLFWARAFGGLRYQQENNGDPASHTSHYGIISGVDHQFENYRLGFFGGAGSVRTATSGNASVTTGDTGFVGVYGSVELHGLQWNASLTAGGIDNEASRSINNGAQTASGDFTGWYVSPELAVSTTYALASRWEITPSAKLRYTGAFYDAYSESGSSQNVSYDSRETHSLDGRLQVELKHTMVLPTGLPASVIATAALGDTQYLGSGKTHASLQNNEFTLSSSGDKNVVGATLGLGFDAMVSKRAAVYGSIDGTLYSDDSVGASGRLGLKVAF